MFTTSELFPSRQPNQCVQCSCSVSYLRARGRQGGLGVCSCTPTVSHQVKNLMRTIVWYQPMVGSFIIRIRLSVEETDLPLNFL